ncbi:hypothetical protein PCE1_004591 [Barthelona sp. PCE]
MSDVSQTTSESFKYSHSYYFFEGFGFLYTWPFEEMLSMIKSLFKYKFYDFGHEKIRKQLRGSSARQNVLFLVLLILGIFFGSLYWCIRHTFQRFFFYLIVNVVFVLIGGGLMFAFLMNKISKRKLLHDEPHNFLRWWDRYNNIIFVYVFMFMFPGCFVEFILISDFILFRIVATAYNYYFYSFIINVAFIYLKDLPIAKNIETEKYAKYLVWFLSFLALLGISIPVLMFKYRE